MDHSRNILPGNLNYRSLDIRPPPPPPENPSSGPAQNPSGCFRPNQPALPFNPPNQHAAYYPPPRPSGIDQSSFPVTTSQSGTSFGTPPWMNNSSFPSGFNPQLSLPPETFSVPPPGFQPFSSSMAAPASSVPSYSFPNTTNLSNANQLSSGEHFGQFPRHSVPQIARSFDQQWPPFHARSSTEVPQGMRPPPFPPRLSPFASNVARPAFIHQGTSSHPPNDQMFQQQRHPYPPEMPFNSPHSSSVQHQPPVKPHSNDRYMVDVNRQQPPHQMPLPILTPHEPAETTITAAASETAKRRRRTPRKKLIGMMQFRSLLREAIVLNEKLRSYHKNHATNQQSASPSVDNSLTVTDHEPDNLDCCSSNQPDVTPPESMSSVDPAPLSGDLPCGTRRSENNMQTVAVASTPAVIIKSEPCDDVEPEDIDCRQIMKRLTELRRRLTESAASVQLRLTNVTKKRKRLKRLRQQSYEEKKAAEERRAKLNQELEKWENEMRIKAENAKMELEMKKAADATLSEVRRKISDVHQRLTLLSKLKKLRQLRKEQAERRGVVTPKAADDIFEERTGSLTDFLKKRLVDYEAEQRTLQVMLETEQEETKEKERNRRLKKMEERLNKYNEQLNSWLFGNNDPLMPDHPIFPYRQYYELASYSVDALVKIRQEWDLFLVPTGLPGGSSLPCGWVTPVEPSSDVWASALASQQ